MVPDAVARNRKPPCYNGKMFGEREKARSWQPRYSVKTLVMLVTVLGAFLGCWVATRTQGVNDVSMRINRDDLKHFGTSEDRPLDDARRAEVWKVKAQAPFVIAAIDWDSIYSGGRYLMASSGHRVYYFWFFGYVVKLPYERRI